MQKNILVLLEGSEEETLFEIAEHDGFAECFNVFYENVGGCGNIAPYFQSEMSDEFYDCIVCVYDVDNRIDINDSAYNLTRNALKKILLEDENVDNVSFCTNPNTLQFFLLGADKLENVKILDTSKSANTDLLHKYWEKLGNKKDYDADEWQLEIIKNSFIYDEYNYTYGNMLKNAEELELDYKNKNPASNLLPLLVALKTGNLDFFINAEKAKEIKE